MAAAAEKLNIVIVMFHNGKSKKHYVGKNILYANLRYLGVLQEGENKNKPHITFIHQDYFTYDNVLRNNHKGIKASVTEIGMKWLELEMKAKITAAEYEYLEYFYSEKKYSVAA